MGNSPLAGQGVNEPHDQRDVDEIESLGARPQETKTKIDEASDPRSPQLQRLTNESAFLGCFAALGPVGSLQDGVIITLHKRKGSKNEIFGNYRQMSLLTIPVKVFAHVLLAVEPTTSHTTIVWLYCLRIYTIDATGEGTHFTSPVLDTPPA